MSTTQENTGLAESMEMQAVLDFLSWRYDTVMELGEENPLQSPNRPLPRRVRLHCLVRDEPCGRKEVEATYIVWLVPFRSKCVVDVDSRIRYKDQRESFCYSHMSSVGADYLLGLGITARDLLYGFVSHFKCKAAGLRATADRCLLLTGGALTLFPHLITAKEAA